MTVKQISAFLENKPGALAAFAKILQSSGIDLRALSLAETDAYKTVQILKEEGYVCSVTPVLAVVFEDKPGALVNVLNLLGDNGINLEYSYAFLAKRANSACMIFRVADNEAAIKVLTANGLKPICQDDLESMFK